MAIIENLSYTCTKLLIKLHADKINESLFLEGSIRGLLIEALDDSDQKEMEAAVKGYLDELKSFGGSMPDNPEWDELFKPIFDMMGGSSNIGPLYDEGGDPKARADAAAEITKKLQDGGGELAALIAGIGAVSAELKKYKVEDGGEKTIGELAKDADGKEFPTTDQISAAAKKAYAIPDWFNKSWETGSKEAEAEAGGGIFKKIGNFIKGLFGGDKAGNLVPADSFLAAILASPYEAFVNINTANVEQKIAGFTQQIGAETGEATAGAAAAQSGEEAAKSGKADPAAADAGIDALAQDKDTAKGVMDAVKSSSETAYAALQAALGGNMDSLSPRDQTIAQRITQLFAAGPDGSNPEDAAKVATDAVEDADKEVSGQFKNADVLADLGDKHMGDGAADAVKSMLSDPDAQKLFAHRLPRRSRRLHENSLASLLFEQDEAIAIEDIIGALAKAGEASGFAPGEDEVAAWAKDVNDQELLDKKIALPGSEEAVEDLETMIGDSLLPAFEAMFEKNEEAAIAMFEIPAKELGLDPAKFVELLQDPAALKASADEAEYTEELATQLQAIKEKFETLAAAGEEIAGPAEELAAAYEEAAKEDEEKAQQALEEPAEQLGLEVPALTAALEDPESFLVATGLNIEETKPADIATALQAALEALSGEGDSDKKDGPKKYSVEEIEKKLQDAFNAAKPEWSNEDFADTMIMALSTYVQEEVEEIAVVAEGKILIYEKYDFEAVKKYMIDQMGDLGEEAGSYGGQETIIADFLKIVTPALAEDGVEISGIPDPEAEDPEAAEVEAALTKAAQSAAKEPEAPAIAIGNALDGWFDTLSASGQKVLQQKDRIGSLKQAVDSSLENAANAIAAEVEKAVDGWWKEHGETLVKSKKFSQKAGDTLRAEIPSIAAAMLAQKAEGRFRLTRPAIKRATHRYLDRKYLSNSVMQESARWQKLAGIIKG